MSRFRRLHLALLILVAILFIGAAPVAASEGKPTRRPELAALAAVSSRVSWAWQRITAPLAALWAKGGGSMDPNGQPLPPPPSSAESDGRGSMDPDGQP